jgi:uncharacterized membrane protein YdjX (TVP38/TMEM64 family)
VISRLGLWAKLLLLVVIVAAGWLAMRATPLREYVESGRLSALIVALRQAWWAPFAFVAGYALAVTFGFSGLVLTLAGGAVFGFWWGALLNTLGANLGATGAFWLARVLGRDGLQALLGGRLAGIDRITHQSGFAWLLRLRLIPIVPFNLLNFASGLTAIPWRTFALATALGILPGALVYTFFADAILSGSQQATRDAYVRVAIAGVLLVLLSFVPTLAKRSGWLPADHDDRLTARPPDRR